MANGINLSASIRTNLLSLQSTNALFGRTSERLSTGLKINSALDGASPYFTARSLNNRASDLTSLKDGMGQGIQTLKAADKGLVSLTKLVDQAKSIANQAKQAAAVFSKASSVTATSTTNSATTTATAAFAALAVGNIITIQTTGGTAVAFTISATTTVQGLMNGIAGADSALTMSFNATTSKIELTATAGTDVTLTSATSVVTNLFGTAMSTGVAKVFGATGSAGTTASLEADFEKVMTAINSLVGDTGYKGVNLLNGNDLTVTINESSTTLTVSSSTLNVTGLGYGAATVDFNVAANIDTAITESDAALAKIRSVSSGFSADLGILQTREDFTNNMVQTLESGAGLLVNANLEEESANLLALQTRQALGTSSLSFANQAQQSVLQLFR